MRLASGTNGSVVAGLLTVPSLLAVLVIVIGCSKVDARADESPQMAEFAKSDLQTADRVLRIHILTPNPSSGELPVQRMNLGSVHQGVTLRRTLIVENCTAEPVKIDIFESSCECITLRDCAATIGRGDCAAFQLVFDSRNEPPFRGVLGVKL
jgi:hypothetical protein